MLLFLMFALLAGVILPVQPGVNAHLRATLGNPLAAAFLGAATLVAAAVAGQMFISVVLDQYGLIGYPPHPLTVARALGVVLVIGGVILIQR
jgi:uncharacterized membrane protein YdcZ (DUF606 family)